MKNCKGIDPCIFRWNSEPSSRWPFAHSPLETLPDVQGLSGPRIAYDARLEPLDRHASRTAATSRSSATCVKSLVELTVYEPAHW